MRDVEAAAGRPDDLAGRIAQALAEAPEPAIPQGFVTRVAKLGALQAPQQQARWHGFGARAAIASGVVLTAALFFFAPHAAPSLANLRFDLQLLLLTELAGVGYVVTRVAESE